MRGAKLRRPGVSLAFAGVSGGLAGADWPAGGGCYRRCVTGMARVVGVVGVEEVHRQSQSRYGGEVRSATAGKKRPGTATGNGKWEMGINWGIGELMGQKQHG